jgi:tetratricopeptide (TPR) repeat protein
VIASETLEQASARAEELVARQGPGDLEQAAEAWLRCLGGAESARPDVRRKLAALLLELGRFKEAADAIAPLRRSDADAPLWIQASCLAGRDLEASRQRLTELEKTLDAGEWSLLRSRLELACGDRAAASRSLKLFPDSRRFRTRGRLERLEPLLLRASIEGDDAAVRDAQVLADGDERDQLLADFHLARRRFAASTALLTRWIRSNPNSAALPEWARAVLTQAGCSDDGLRDLRSASALMPASSLARSEIVAWLDLREGLFEKARGSGAFRSDRREHAVAQALAEAYSGRPTEAMIALREAQVRFGPRLELVDAMALTLLELGQPAAATRLSYAVTEDSRSTPLHRLHLAAIRLAANDLPDAERQYRRAREADLSDWLGFRHDRTLVSKLDAALGANQ